MSPPILRLNIAFFCGRRRVAVARYGMICLVPASKIFLRLVKLCSSLASDFKQFLKRLLGTIIASLIR